MADIFIEHKIIILVPFRNTGDYLIDCVNSIVAQQYPNYEVYLLDDDSDDGSYESIKDFVEATPHFHYLKNESRLGALANLHKALTEISMDNEDIITIVDGDDQLFGEYSLQILNYAYDDQLTLLTYGQFIDSYGNIAKISAYTAEEFQHLRTASWKATHLKTFKYRLFKDFLQQDPACENFKTEDGSFYPSTYDMAMMFPLMEMAGYKSCTYIPNVLYCYRLHPQNDHATPEGRKLQIESELHIRSRASLAKILSKKN